MRLSIVRNVKGREKFTPNNIIHSPSIRPRHRSLLLNVVFLFAGTCAGLHRRDSLLQFLQPGLRSLALHKNISHMTERGQWQVARARADTSIRNVIHQHCTWPSASCRPLSRGYDYSRGAQRRGCCIGVRRR